MPGRHWSALRDFGHFAFRVPQLLDREVHIPPDITIDAPVHAGGLGRYHLVADGALLVEKQSLPPLSLVWTSGEDEMLPLRAGAEGAAVIVMQFPGDAI